MSEWKTIDSAPKDGTYILALIIGFLPSVAKFEQGRWLTFDPDAFCCDECWSEYISGTEYNPTHWMPLPTPPGVN